MSTSLIGWFLTLNYYYFILLNHLNVPFSGYLRVLFVRLLEYYVGVFLNFASLSLGSLRSNLFLYLFSFSAGFLPLTIIVFHSLRLPKDYFLRLFTYLIRYFTKLLSKYLPDPYFFILRLSKF